MDQEDRSYAAPAEFAVKADSELVPPEVLAAVTPPPKPVHVRGKHKKMPQNKDSFHRTKAAKRIDSQKRMVVKAILDSGEELPLAYALEHMHTNAKMARFLEAQPELTMQMRQEAREFRDDALAAATVAMPYLHAKLAPIVAKGEKGVSVQLIIEDA